MNRVVICLLVWSIAIPAQGWNATGHRIIASIAFRQLDPEQQVKIADMLRRHPRFTPDFQEVMPADVKTAGEDSQNEWLLQQAAVWPDMVRSGPAEKRAYNRSEWHYINLPIFLNRTAVQTLASKLTANVDINPPADAMTTTARMNVVQ